jgi:SH3-like domain-containing protein
VRRIALFSGIGMGVVCILLVVLITARLSDLSRTDVAVLMPEVATVKNSPDAKSSDAFVLHSGVKVQIVDRVSSWVKVRLADGKVGWVEGAALEVI